jgi:N-methylhydantoinase A
MNYRISVDTGGTFTDVVVMDSLGSRQSARHSRRRSVRSAVSETPLRSLQTKSTPHSGRCSQRPVCLSTVRPVPPMRCREDGAAYDTGFPGHAVFKEGGRANAHDFSRDYPEPYIPRRRTFEVRVVAELKARRIEGVPVCLLWSLVLLLLSGPAAKTAPTSDGCQPGGL